MTTQIYVQTTEVLNESTRHLGIWIVQDDVATLLRTEKL